MEMFLAESGAKVHVRRGALYVRLRDGGRIAVAADVDQLIIATSRVSITAKAVRAAAKMGLDIVFLDPWGNVVARIYPPVINKTVTSRIAQYSSVGGMPARAIAREIVYAKIHNQAQTLKYVGKSRREGRIVDAGWEIEYVGQELLNVKLENVTPETLMSFEARAARRYWSIIAELLPSHLGFEGRDPEGGDVFNIALNYGYGILYGECERALILAGLDPYLGLFHTLKSGRPSLTLDFIEMFRAPAVDKALVVNAHRLGEVRLVNGLLAYDSRKLIASIILESLNSNMRSTKRFRSLKLRDHVRLEAYDLAAAFRGDSYSGFKVVY